MKNKTINVLVVVNTASLDQGKPQVYMISDHAGDKGEGSPELSVVAKEGDYIHWRAISVNLKDDVEIIDFEQTGGETVVKQPFFTELGWTTKVVAQGDESYTLTFSINGEGLFSWDPKIIITP